MPYDPQLVQPMRDDLTANGFQELLTAEDVDAALSGKKGSVLLVINSVCGCAAGQARPGVIRSLAESSIKPDKLTTVFAGQDLEATDKARNYIIGYPPSSPAVALFKDGELAFVMERQHIETRSDEMIAKILKEAFEEYLAESDIHEEKKDVG
jgi:putative YphP/YqiW family bacilliredoxin